MNSQTNKLFESYSMKLNEEEKQELEDAKKALENPNLKGDERTEYQHDVSRLENKENLTEESVKSEDLDKEHDNYYKTMDKKFKSFCNSLEVDPNDLDDVLSALDELEGQFGDEEGEYQELREFIYNELMESDNLNEGWSPNDSLQIVEFKDYDDPYGTCYGKFNDGNYFVAGNGEIGIFDANPSDAYGFSNKDYDVAKADEIIYDFITKHEIAGYTVREDDEYNTLVELIKDAQELKTLGNIKNLVDLEKTEESAKELNEEDKGIYDYTEEDVEKMNLDEMIKLYARICIESDMDVTNLLRFLNNSGCLNTGSFRNMLEDTINYMHFND